jgi:hypothetical protein
MSKIFRCPFCRKTYVRKPGLYQHMDEAHSDLEGGLPASQVYFNHSNRYALTRGSGRCIVDGRPTRWNPSTEKYERLCSEECIALYRKKFQERMREKYGVDTLASDPEQQRRMLAARDISGWYEWRDRGELGPRHRTSYVGKFEHDFLEFLDLFCNWNNPEDIIAPAPMTLEYELEGQRHFYIPDFYIGSLDLIVEIKSEENKGYRLRDLSFEEAKDAALDTCGHKWMKVYDKKYSQFFEYLTQLKN